MATNLLERERALVTGCGRGIAYALNAGMTVVMKELARVRASSGIRVNAIAPGAIPGGGFVAGNLGDPVNQIPLGRPARRMTFLKWRSRFCQKDLVVTWWVPQ